MNFGDIDFENLPSGREESFIFLEEHLRRQYEIESQDDRKINYDRDGEYAGNYEPERTYVSGVLAFLDELGIEVDVPDITNYSREDGNAFITKFGEFRQIVRYFIGRFRLRKARMEAGSAGTVISIELSYKAEIGKLLETIRKIVNQEVRDAGKRDRIFKKISSLQSEVDRDQTTVDSLFGLAIDLTRTIGECADNLESLLDKVERLRKLIWDNSAPVDYLPKKLRPRLIQTESNESDEEVPF